MTASLRIAFGRGMCGSLPEAATRGKVTGEPGKLAAERTAIRDQLAGLKGYEALEGAIGFGADHDAIKPIYIVEAKGGKWTLLDTRNAE